MDGSYLLYRAVAYAVGAALALPLLLTLLFRERWVRVFRRLFVVGVSLAIGLALAELVVRVLDVPAFSKGVLRPDPDLGYTFEPGTGGSDAWGFRNPAVPARVDLFCTGDSQTWGTNLRRDETWPFALARRSGRSVYSAALSGYGALQFLALLDRAEELDAPAVVIGFYFGNDLPDAHRFASLPRWESFRRDDVPYRDPVFAIENPVPNVVFGVLDGLMTHSRVLHRLGTDAKLALRNHPALAELYWVDESQPHVADGPLATYLTPEYRRAALDTGDVTIADGLRITREAFTGIGERAAAGGYRVAVLFIHTKELAYWHHFADRDPSLAARLAGLAEAESAVTGELAAHLEGAGLRVVDPLPDMLAALAEGRSLWPAHSDGHIDAAGSALCAAVLERELADWLDELPR